MLDMILKMSVSVLLMCALTAAVRLAELKTAYGRLSAAARRWIVGALFGAAAVFSTHFGVEYESMILNVRDIAPLSAGLLFDPWAGIIAGLIGGLERFAAGQWLGIGSFTRVACCVSTMLAGVLAALLRKLLFENKRPSAFYSFAIGGVMEVFHMLAVLLTRLDSISQAYAVVKVCSAPMIAFTAAGLCLCTVCIAAINGQLHFFSLTLPKERTPITRAFQLRLLLFVTVAFALTFSFTYTVETRLTLSDAQDLLDLNTEDIGDEIDRNESNLDNAIGLVKQQALVVGRAVAQRVSYLGGAQAVSGEDLAPLKELFGVYEIDVVGEDGVICASTNANYIGYDMNYGEQSAEFLKLLEPGAADFVQDFQPISYNASLYVMYAGCVTDGGFVQVGYDNGTISKFEALADITQIASDRRVGETGYALLMDKFGLVLSGKREFIDKKLSELGVQTIPDFDEYTFCEIGGESCYCVAHRFGDYIALLALPTAEVFESRDIFAYEIAFMEILLFAAVYVLIFQLVKTNIIRNLYRVNKSLARIAGGDLNVVVDVRENAEFVSLSTDINSTVAVLKHYITEAAARIDRELEFARGIQLAALPSLQPPISDNKRFDLFASMQTAKEVGGDFYDFFLVGPERLALVIADVSGKGIPASLFMMKSKTLIKSLAESEGLSPAGILKAANRKLCEGNDADMFVTVWIGILNTSTGELRCSNAGHEYPAVLRSGGYYDYIHDKHGLVLAAMDGSKYAEYTFTLNPGDQLFVYTDGVTEATDAMGGLFGADRLLAALNASRDAAPKELIPAVKREIDDFANGAPQFDDITMLSLRLLGCDTAAEVFRASVESLDDVQAFVRMCAVRAGAGKKELSDIALACEEAFVNIASYAYPGGEGDCTVRCSGGGDSFSVSFCDGGVPYDPLSAADPDVSLSAQERGIGGLGVFLIKKLMDDVSYAYSSSMNVLTLEKKLEGDKKQGS